MSSILLVTSSPRGNDSLSSKVAHDLANELSARDNGTSVVHRDLGANPIPHLDSVTTSAIRKQAADRTPAEAAAADYSDKLVAELMAADTLVIATGLINFNIYSTLKSWIDNVARAGQTFRYTAAGPEGLATGKKAYIVLASGGVYSEGPAAGMNHALPYLTTVLGFLGMTDVEVVYVEGVAFGPEAAEKAIASAQQRNRQLALAA
ncbi:FMN-dependent NADH-azoreductase [Neorhizobium galegae]|uniref:FMN-dependent NADH-azoreductase n=1 Tax=Neorhizobium galegae TaxID=399 RepID=UPI0006211D54|nr:FMN-dependent NADH-azoreductase [Neorhizobium galegae]CDZ28118.1 NADPH-dependent FMN reductase family protein [Neorhizobium galegae bv. officinalis]KAA9386854.1 FMN-dependent NADH-azoreductase [Neorhizobium galegae]KAB1115997.1 FMN-dependent NADH-azoreductase [Neorhizobium galegae]MCM2499640.1 FMN-dependent NADH-azoreductase [Neorhizobium galegae]MCQ1764742.1 FMN-dependent NADH-azoreductase [Neorhizobium galegae]